ncbi:MAG: AAA domain-containing protein [Chitinivibrionales bacterium]|nr:AAA domain-containing protein [Chitinivibrionales bacterium]
MNKTTIDGVDLTLSHPVAARTDWVGQTEPLRQLLACWLTIAPEDMPLTPRLLGFPGTGKTTLAMAAAVQRKQDVYIMQCTSDTRPEDLLITPVLSSNGSISYHASPLLSAVITGGVAVLDEGNRMSEKSWASLAGLFDHRRMVESVVAGITVGAHKEFRAVVTMNEDSSTFEIPDYIMSRLQPGIELGHPTRDDELRILSYNLPFTPEEVLNLCVDFLQKAHGLDLPYSVRDGINIIRYTLKQRHDNPDTPTADLLETSIRQVLGAEALDLDSLAARRKVSGEHLPGMNLGDFFFGGDDPLNPDVPEGDDE